MLIKKSRSLMRYLFSRMNSRWIPENLRDYLKQKPDENRNQIAGSSEDGRKKSKIKSGSRDHDRDRNRSKKIRI
ncbi:hypothetical protein LINPERPRIM_LOCUS26935 [Linum perenne]